MSSKNKENQGPQDPRKIAVILRQQDKKIVSPIDLSLVNVKSLKAEQLQWLNFYEPPLKLTLSNIGDTVMVRGQWPNLHQRPTLLGGPLDGHYVFSQAHFHWDTPSHAHAKHTIDCSEVRLEMHALFYKSSYQDQAEAQEKEDGIVIAVYFFKVEEGSSFAWMTDQLGRVEAAKASWPLPPAPLCALMVPFTRDYLAYHGALACSCHHVLWLVSRTPLRITERELENFNNVQSIPKEQTNDENLKIVKTAHSVYQINSSNGNDQVLIPQATDPPCQITTSPNKITIAVDYVKMMTQDETTNNTSEDEPNQENNPDVSLDNCLLQETDTSTIYSDWKSDLQTSESKTQLLCDLCKKARVHIKGVKKLSRKSSKRGIASKRNLESDKIEIVGKMKLLEKERRRGNKSVEFWKRENEANRRLLKKEREQMKMMKKVWADQMKQFAEIKFEAEQLKRLAEKNEFDKIKSAQRSELRKTSNVSVADEAISSPRRQRSPIQKSVLTSKPKVIFVDQNNLHSKRENADTNNNLIPNNQGEGQTNVQSERLKSALNESPTNLNNESLINARIESPRFASIEETGGSLRKEGQAIKKKFVPLKPSIPRSRQHQQKKEEQQQQQKQQRPPVKLKEGLKSSLTPLFSENKDRPVKKPDDSAGHSVKPNQTSKFSQRIVNRTKPPQRRNTDDSTSFLTKHSINYYPRNNSF